MKRILIAVSAFIGIVGLNVAFAADEKMQHQNHHHDMSMTDTRISLGLSAEMKQHQLSNMREHVEAVKSIIGLMSENKFEDASKIAHSKLGLTPEMQQMCSMFGDEKFMALGFAFHKSGDDLGDALKTRDVATSLRALNKTMEYCVSCHATYRQ
ncbi:MAG: cytochrome C [Gallionellales bacterium RIFCSPLOWO2_02_60_31]|nr:MAG: cytochrome C [Gallionellales bacterium RIFCSPLOWO2_02_60_31]